MSIIISGSMAFDTIMVFPDSFKNHIIADKIHILNVCFLVPEMRKEFGGCAGNIAYNLNLLEQSSFPIATVGEDFTLYKKWMKKCGVDDRYITIAEGNYTAQAYLTTDIDDNQIIAFHPGAMNLAHENKISADMSPSLGIIAPNGKSAMIEHAEQFHDLNVPFFFDPGQGLPMFNKAELHRFIEIADYIVVNDYESEMLSKNSGLSIEQIAQLVNALIVTRGSKGAQIFAQGNQIDIPTATISKAVDPTGCGDAFRAGLLYGITHNLDWQTAGRMASLLGGIKIEHPGTQNHQFSLDEFKQRYQASFGQKLDLPISS